jgi:hypothetical protein
MLPYSTQDKNMDTVNMFLSKELQDIFTYCDIIPNDCWKDFPT